MHDCISCGCACYCHGDIDDCQVEHPRYSAMHCTGCGCEEDPLFDEWEHDYSDDAPAQSPPAPGAAP